MKKVSCDINKIMHHSSGKYWLINRKCYLKALTKPQDIMPPKPAIDSRTSGTNCASNSYETNWTLSWQANNFGIPHFHNNEAYHSQRPYETPVSPHVYVGKQPPNLTPFDFNQSVAELFRCQTKLTHSTQ